MGTSREIAAQNEIDRIIGVYKRDLKKLEALFLENIVKQKQFGLDDEVDKFIAEDNNQFIAALAIYAKKRLLNEPINNDDIRVMRPVARGLFGMTKGVDYLDHYIFSDGNEAVLGTLIEYDRLRTVLIEILGDSELRKYWYLQDDKRSAVERLGAFKAYQAEWDKIEQKTITYNLGNPKAQVEDTINAYLGRQAKKPKLKPLSFVHQWLADELQREINDLDDRYKNNTDSEVKKIVGQRLTLLKAARDKYKKLAFVEPAALPSTLVAELGRELEQLKTQMFSTGRFTRGKSSGFFVKVTSQTAIDKIKNNLPKQFSAIELSLVAEQSLSQRRPSKS